MSRTLVIHVDEVSQLACDFIFQDRAKPLKSDVIEQSIRDWSKGKRGLWILAAHTALKKSHGGATDSESVIDLPMDSSPYIDALFDTASRDSDRSRSDKKSGEHWILGIFDQSPREIYLKAFQHDRRKLVCFTNEVTVSIRWNKTGKKCTSEELRRLRDFWILGGTFHIKSVFITVHAITNSGILSLGQDATRGYLTNQCSVSVEIKSSFLTHFCVLWIDSENTAFCLHPFPDPCLEIDSSTFINSVNGGSLVIPENDYLPITTGAGVETCIALWREKAFTKSDAMQIVEKVGLVCIDPMIPRIVKAPRSIHGYLTASRSKEGSTERKNASERLGKPRSPTAWEKAITNALKGAADAIQFFHRPNKSLVSGIH